MPVEGYDDAIRKLNEFSDKVHDLANQKSVPFEELFIDSFMSTHTDFQTFQQMLDASGIEDAEEINGEAWSNFVASHSRFTGWDDMFGTAGAEWMKRKLES